MLASFIYIYIYIYIYVYMCVCVCVCVTGDSLLLGLASSIIIPSQVSSSLIEAFIQRRISKKIIKLLCMHYFR